MLDRSSDSALQRPAKILIGALATIGAAYVIFAIYATVFLSDCLYIPGAIARSPNGEFLATFDQTQCKDVSKSNSRVLLGFDGRPEKSVVFDVEGTSDVGLTWNGDGELQVLLPKSAVAKRYSIDEALPRVTEIRRPWR